MVSKVSQPFWFVGKLIIRVRPQEKQSSCIQGHDEMCHDWRCCHLNPYSQRYDLKAGQVFYENKAHGLNVWYPDVFQRASGQSYAFSVGQGGGGRDAATIKAAALDSNVVAVVAVSVIRAAAVIQDAADADTTGKAVGAKVHTIKGTKAPTTYQGNVSPCDQGGGGWPNNGWSNNASYPLLA